MEGMANTDNIMEEIVVDGAGDTLPVSDTEAPPPKSGHDLILGRMNAHFKALNENQTLTNTRIGVLTLSVADMSSKVGTHSDQIEAMQKDIKLLKDRPQRNIDKQVEDAVRGRMAATETVLDDKLRMLVNKQLDSVTKELDKVKAVQAVQSQNKQKLNGQNTKTGSGASGGPVCSDFDAKFLDCRRSVRLWPIDHSSEQSLWTGVRDFFFDKLSIPHTNLPQESVESIVRVLPGRKKRKIEEEVIVKFISVQVRDMVVSYAPNLRAWRERDGSGRAAAGLRLEIPDHLMSVFKTLERYGHYLKDRYKEGLRRHIRYDDYGRTLVMDYAMPGSDKWERVDFDNAREELRQHAPAQPQRFSSSSASDVNDPPGNWNAPTEDRNGDVDDPQEEKQQEEQPGEQQERMDQNG